MNKKFFLILIMLVSVFQPTFSMKRKLEFICDGNSNREEFADKNELDLAISALNQVTAKKFDLNILQSIKANRACSLNTKFSRLVKLVRQNNIEKVRQLLDLGVDPNIHGSEENSALLNAIDYDNFSLAHLLWYYGADPEAFNNSNKNSTSRYILIDHPQGLGFLLNYTDVSFIDNYIIKVEYAEGRYSDTVMISSEKEEDFKLSFLTLSKIYFYNLKDASALFKQAKNSPDWVNMKLAIEKDLVFIVRFLMGCSVPIFTRHLALAREKNAKSVARFLLNSCKFKAFTAIRLASKDGLGLAGELQEHILSFIDPLQFRMLPKIKFDID